MPPQKPYLRHERVSELIHKELGFILIREMDFNGALVTITAVEVTDKLDYARIHFATIPSERAKEMLKRLNARRPYLQHLLAEKLEIRPMPQLSFLIDHGVEKAAAIEKALLDEEAKE